MKNMQFSHYALRIDLRNGNSFTMYRFPLSMFYFYNLFKNNFNNEFRLKAILNFCNCL